jgi:hypothetical protein
MPGIGASCTNAPILTIPLTSAIFYLLKFRHEYVVLNCWGAPSATINVRRMPSVDMWSASSVVLRDFVS